MSVAAARAAAHVRHIGAVGPDGRWAVDRLLEYGVDTRHVLIGETPTGHAVIAVDPSGENSILIWPGANATIPDNHIEGALDAARPGDILLMQNETNGQGTATSLVRDRGLKIVYAAAPFDADAVAALLDRIDLLVLNAVEAAQLAAARACDIAALPVDHVIVTLGAEGVRHHDRPAGTVRDYPALPVTPVDTTGAGDTFTGYLVAGLDRGMPMGQALTQANRAAAIMVTRHGTADVIPDLKDLEDARLT
jgi:ribokinase